jgi:glutathione synthase/RimK-type ligase-like ATP-grasp enzyme
MVTSGNNLASVHEEVKDFLALMNTSKSQESYEYAVVGGLIFAVTENGISIKNGEIELKDEYDIILLRNVHRFSDFANAIRIYCRHFGVKLINEADASFPLLGKVSQGFVLKVNQIPTPEFISSPSNKTLLTVLMNVSDDLQYPIVIKHNNGVKGINNYLAQTPEEAKQILASDVEGFVIQGFIPNEGELRVLRFGESLPPLVFKKRAVNGAYLNNTSQGGEAELIDAAVVDKAIMQDALKASELMGRDIGGVDVLLSLDGSYSILEVNSTPALATGAYTVQKADYLSDYVQLLIGKGE